MPVKPHKHLQMLPDALPEMQRLMKLRKHFTIPEIDGYLVTKYDIKDADRGKLANGVDRFTNRVAWLLVQMQQQGMARKIEDSRYQLTELLDTQWRGLATLEDICERINKRFDKAA